MLNIKLNGLKHNFKQHQGANISAYLPDIAQRSPKKKANNSFPHKKMTRNTGTPICNNKTNESETTCPISPLCFASQTIPCINQREFFIPNQLLLYRIVRNTTIINITIFKTNYTTP